MAQIVVGMFLPLLLHNLLAVALVQFMDVALIVQYQNLTKLVQIVLDTHHNLTHLLHNLTHLLHNLLVVALVQFMDAVLIVMYQNLTKLVQIVLDTHRHLLRLHLRHLRHHRL
jgi:hypothetical protein